MDFDAIYNMILTIGMGAITFFLKRSFDKLDSRARVMGNPRWNSR